MTARTSPKDSRWGKYVWVSPEFSAFRRALVKAGLSENTANTMMHLASSATQLGLGPEDYKEHAPTTQYMVRRAVLQFAHWKSTKRIKMGRKAFENAPPKVSRLRTRETAALWK